MLYTTAGATECVLPATSDKDLMYKALAHIQQAEGSMDTAQLVSAVYSEIQSDYQALAPRKAAMIVTDAGQVLSNMALFGTLASRCRRPDRHGGLRLPDDRRTEAF